MTERTLSEDERSELEELITEGLELLGTIVEFPENPDDSPAVVQSIRECVDALRNGEMPGSRERMAASLGALWGDELRRTLGWEWLMLDEGKGELLGLVSQDRSVALRPQLAIYRLLAWPETDNTVMLLYNMLRENQLPGTTPRTYSLLG